VPDRLELYPCLRVDSLDIPHDRSIHIGKKFGIRRSDLDRPLRLDDVADLSIGHSIVDR
jgi:hypothetical protein